MPNRFRPVNCCALTERNPPTPSSSRSQVDLHFVARPASGRARLSKQQQVLIVLDGVLCVVLRQRAIDQPYWSNQPEHSYSWTHAQARSHHPRHRAVEHPALRMRADGDIVFFRARKAEEKPQRPDLARLDESPFDECGSGDADCPASRSAGAGPAATSTSIVASGKFARNSWMNGVASSVATVARQG